MYGYRVELLQKDSLDQEYQPTMSRKTTETEEKYPTYELEVLGIVQAQKKWIIF